MAFSKSPGCSTRLGDAYWVHAHVTATFGNDGQIIGYHSNRRCPAKSALDTIRPIYAALLAEEARHDDSKSGMDAASALLARTLSSRGMSYEEFVFSL